MDYSNSIDKTQVFYLSQILADKITDNRESLISLLVTFESYSYAVDEIKRSVDTLLNIEKEIKYYNFKTDMICSFLPINQPLYGLIIFGIIPSFFATTTKIRPSADSYNIVVEISNMLDLNSIFDSVEILNISRKKYCFDYLTKANITIFVGKYENAIVAQSYTKPESLFIFSGAGANPFVVTENSDLDKCVDKAIEARIYNSGQDCAAPNAFFVNKKCKKEFINILTGKLKKIKIGNYSDNSVMIGSLIRKESFKNAIEKIVVNDKKIIYGGSVDIARRIIYPTVIDVKISDKFLFEELYAPVFTVSQYEREIDLKQYFFDERYSKQAMYVSVFGLFEHPEYLNNSIILSEKNVVDFEQGNMCFGGFGTQANYLSTRNGFISRPILISKEISEFLGGKK